MDYGILLKLFISLTMLLFVHGTTAHGELLEDIHSEDTTPASKSFEKLAIEPHSRELLEMNDANILYVNHGANASQARIPRKVRKYPRNKDETNFFFDSIKDEMKKKEKKSKTIDKFLEDDNVKIAELKNQIEKKRLTLARIENLRIKVKQTEKKATFLIEMEENNANALITKLQQENDELKKNKDVVNTQSVEDQNKIVLLQTEKKIVEDKIKQLEIQKNELKIRSDQVSKDSEFLNNWVLNLTVQVENVNSARQKTENDIRNCENKAQNYLNEKNQKQGEAQNTQNIENQHGFIEKFNEIKRVDHCCVVKRCGVIDKTKFLPPKMLEEYKGYTFKPVTQPETKSNSALSVKGLFGNTFVIQPKPSIWKRFGRSPK